MGSTLEMTFKKYQAAREYALNHPHEIAGLERWAVDLIASHISKDIDLIRDDYDAASALRPFWQNYPPDDRGRSPKGDQIPWIEVGEHAVGTALMQALSDSTGARDVGFPTGPDQRLVLRDPEVGQKSSGVFPALWLMIDVKSAGPRDDFPYVVMSHNQISGDGLWASPIAGVRNGVMTAQGPRTSHPFHPSLPPIIVLPNLEPALVVTMAIKPIYAMGDHAAWAQPLSRLDLICIPNGLLLTENPGILKQHPGLLRPGKDAKDKNPLKARTRISKQEITAIDSWRWVTVWSAKSATDPASPAARRSA